MPTAPDHVIRALTDDGSFRVLTARTTLTCREAVRKQAATGEIARHLAELLTGTVLVRETMAPTLRVQGIVRGAAGGCTLVGDSFPDGGTRGLVNLRSGHHELDLSHDSVMQFMRSLPNGSVHRGVVEMLPDGGISAGLMAYMQDSEQIFTVTSVCALFDAAGEVRSSGGFVVQLLPDAHHDLLAVMTERLAADFADISRFVGAETFDPDALLEDILYQVPFLRVETRQVSFHCPCDQTSVLASLSTLQTQDIQQFIDDGEVLDIACDYCRQDYQVAPDQLRGLVSQS